MDIYPIALWLVFLFVIYTGIRRYENSDVPYEVRACLEVILRGWRWRKKAIDWNQHNIIQSGLNYTSIVLCLISPFICKLFKIRPVKLFRLYPFFYALVPVILYFVFIEFTDRAFWGCLFFICFPLNYFEIPNRTKSMIAQVFMVSALYFMLNGNTGLVILFGLLTIFSHYTVGIILLGWIGSVFLVTQDMGLLISGAVIAGLSVPYFMYAGSGVLFSILKVWQYPPGIHDDYDAFRQLLGGRENIKREKYEGDIPFVEVTKIGVKESDLEKLPFEEYRDYLSGPFFYEKVLKPPYYIKKLPARTIPVLIYIVIGVLLIGTVYWTIHPELFLGQIGMTSILFFSGMMVTLAYFKKFKMNRLFLSMWVQFASIPMSVLFGVSSNWIPVPVLGVILVSMLVLAR